MNEIERELRDIGKFGASYNRDDDCWHVYAMREDGQTTDSVFVVKGYDPDQIDRLLRFLRYASIAALREIEPVAWMYHHPTLLEYEFVKSAALRDRLKVQGAFPADGGWTETPLYALPTPPETK